MVLINIRRKVSCLCLFMTCLMSVILTDFVTEELEGGEVKEQPILKCVNDLAVENYTMREVFNMDSSVRLDAINNLGKNGQ